jgi:hypothetical protein
MKTSSSRRFPVTASHLPVAGCQICLGTVAYRPGGANEVRTDTTRVHLEAFGVPCLVARLRISVPVLADLGRP